MYMYTCTLTCLYTNLYTNLYMYFRAVVTFTGIEVGFLKEILDALGYVNVSFTKASAFDSSVVLCQPSRHCL